MSSLNEGHAGWDKHHEWNHRGFMFAPLIPLVFVVGAIATTVFIFSSGLWIPLLLIGAIFYFFSPRSHAWRQDGQKWAKGWGQRWNSENWSQRWNSEEWSKRWNSEGHGKHWGRGRSWSFGCSEESQAEGEGKAKREPTETSYTEAPKRKTDRTEYV